MVEGPSLPVMGMRDISRVAVLRALEEHDRIGRDAFLRRYGFAPAQRYVLVHGDQRYDSKAVVGAAHAYALPQQGPLSSEDFSGGVSGAAKVLTDLGFTVERVSRSSAGRAPTVLEARAAHPPSKADVLLLGCVKTKQGSPAPAEDLYTSPLFQKRRAYAERSGATWFILSALHGLLLPDELVEPYDMALADQDSSYRQRWGKRVLASLSERLVLEGLTVEIHAGAAYVDAIEPGLRGLGARVVVPLRGLNQGQHLAWYGATPPRPDAPAPNVDQLVTELVNEAAALPCSAFPWGRSDLRQPGLYSWWVDTDGAHELTAGLGHRVPTGLVYAGQAGASSSVAGRERQSTLESRITQNHLRGGTSSSTWRKTLTGVLAPAAPDELNSWMARHLRLIAVPVLDRAGLARLEEAVLRRIDPPLNLAHMSMTPLRYALKSARSRVR